MMDEFVCRVSAEMQKDREIAIRVDGDFADVILCIGGLIRSASDFAEVSVEELAEDAVLCAKEQTMKEWEYEETD